MEWISVRLCGVAFGGEVVVVLFYKSTRPEVNGVCLMSGMEVGKLQEKRHQHLIV